MKYVYELKNPDQIYNNIAKVVLPLITSIVSAAPNAMYDASAFMDMVMYMCRENGFVAPCARSLKRRNLHVMCGGRLLQLLGQPKRDAMSDMCSSMLDASVAEMVSRGKFAHAIILAIDEHLIARYTKKDNPNIKGGKKKSGTNFFEGYMTAQSVSGKTKATLAARAIKNGDSQSEHVAELIKHTLDAGIKIKHVLLDRGFNSVANIRTLQELGIKFIMPLKGSKTLYGMMREVEAKEGPAIREYTMTSGDGSSVTATLVICPKNNPKSRKNIQDRYIAFLTNIQVSKPEQLLRRIPKLYKARWGIETGYRVLEDIRAKTKSPKVTARLFFLFFSLVFMNFWVLYRVKRTLHHNTMQDLCIPISDYADILWLYISECRKPP